MSRYRERAVSLFQRIKTPFSETAEEQDEVQPRPRARAVGELLRARREQLGLDLDRIGEALRIRPAYLAALEQGRIEELPGPAYAMGFVRAYANHLDLDGDRVLARYKADTADVHIRPDLSLPVPLGERSLPGGPILLVALILALCGYGTWYYLSTGERARPERVAAVPADLRPPGVPSIATPAAPAPQTVIQPGPDADSPALPKPTPALVSGADFRPPADLANTDLPPSRLTANPTAAAPSPPAATTRPSGAGAPDPIIFPGSPPAQAPAVAPQPASALAPPTATTPTSAAPAAMTAATGSPPLPSVANTPPTSGAIADGRVAIRALADCWIQVRAADQAILFSRVLKAGETYHVPGRTGLALRTGNAGALAVEVDGKAAPSIGPIGTLRRNVALDPDALAAGTAVHG
jgi:cytoskeleton protein RodZ